MESLFSKDVNVYISDFLQEDEPFLFKNIGINRASMLQLRNYKNAIVCL